MAVQTYYKLRPGKGYLQGIKAGPNETLQDEDVIDAELWAWSYINEQLKAWPNDPLSLVPPTVARWAHQLGAAFCLDIAERNSAEHAGQKWRKMAVDEIAAVKNGDAGLRLADGSWDPDYIGNNNPEEGRTGNLDIIAT